MPFFSIHLLYYIIDPTQRRRRIRETEQKRAAIMRMHTRACPDETFQLQLFCSTFECIKLYCVPATILPDVAMSDAARVNEPFPGPLAAEYYIDNRNCLPSERAKTSSSGGRRLYVRCYVPSRSTAVPRLFLKMIEKYLEIILSRWNNFLRNWTTFFREKRKKN